MNNFENTLDTLIKTTAYEKFHISALKPFQQLIIHSILEHSDEEKSKSSALLAVLPTGGGKSLCFMIPALLCSGLTIITYPLLALMEDQGRRLKEVNIPYALLKGGQSKEEREEALSLIASGKAKILITNIETLSQHKILSILSDMYISLLVADEAHTLITWGEEFRPIFLEFNNIIKALKPAELLAFTATCDERTKSSIEKLFSPLPLKIIYGGLDRENIIYHSLISLFPIEDIKEIVKKKESRPAIIFTQSREDTKKLAAKLKPFFNVKFYHAMLDKEQRVEIERWFAKEKNAILVSTCAYGMGVDKKNIRTVIHYSLPKDASSYLQESGRCGRDGKESHAYVLLKRGETSPLLTIFEGDKCFRRELIKAMGRGLDNACSGCDVCDKVVITGYAYNYIIERIKRYPFFYTKITIANLLMRLSRGNLDKREIESAIDYLVERKKVSTMLSRLYIRRKGCAKIKTIQNEELIANK